MGAFMFEIVGRFLILQIVRLKVILSFSDTDAKSGLSLLGVHLKRNARPATPSRVGRLDKMSDPFSNGTAIAGKRTNLQGSGVVA
jgi:hypothetical protein